MQIITLQISDNNFSVLTLEGEEALAETYCFKVQFFAKAEMVVDTYLFKQAILHLPNRKIVGVITYAEKEYLNVNGLNTITINLEPQLALLKQQYSAACFRGESVVDIIHGSLLKLGYSNIQIHYHLQGIYKKQLYIFQPPDENDYIFLLRLLSHAGIFFWTGASEQLETIHFTDHNISLPLAFKQMLTFIPSSTLSNENTLGFYKLEVENNASATFFKVRGYNQTDPQCLIQTQVGDKTTLEQCYFDPSCKDLLEVQCKANLHYYAAQALQTKLRGKSHIDWFIAGNRFTLNAKLWADNNEFDGNYVIIKIIHSAMQPSGKQGEGNNISYTNTVTFIKEKTLFKMAPHPYPPLPATMIAYIANDDVTLDEDGNYFINEDTIEKNYTVQKIAHALRKLNFYGGLPSSLGNTGEHFPLCNNVPILLRFLHGHPDYPFILGALPNEQQSGPVTANNPAHNLLCSKSDNHLLLDDSLHQPSIRLATANQKNKVVLYAKPGAHELQVNSEDGELKFTVGRNLTINNEQNTWEKIETDRMHQIAGDFCNITQQGDSIHYADGKQEWYAKQNISLKAKQYIHLDSLNSITMHAQQNLNCYGNNMYIESLDGDISLTVNNELLITAIGDNSIILAQGNTKIEITSDGLVNFFSEQITLTGNTFFSTQPNFTN